jgi:ligand-binding sensor domain-containing protein
MTIGTLADGSLCIATDDKLYKTGGATKAPTSMNVQFDTTTDVVFPIVDMVESENSGDMWFAAADGVRRWRGSEVSVVYDDGLGGALNAVDTGAAMLDSASILDVVAGTTTGLYVLTKETHEETTWVYTAEWLDADSLHALPEIDSTIDSLAEVGCDTCEPVWQFYLVADLDSTPDVDTIHDTLWQKVTLPGGKHTVVTILTVPDGMWVGTEGGQLLRHTGDSWTLHEGVLRSYPVYDMAIAPDGALWIAQKGGGMTRFDPSTGEWKLYEVDNCALPDSDVFGVAVEDDGTVWAATKGGLFMFTP